MTGTDLALAARLVVALVLLASGVGKLVALSRTTRGFREEFGSYAWVGYLVAAALPVGELILAGLLLFVDAAWPSYLALAVFAAFTVVLVRRIVKQDRRPCNCFGAASSKRALSTGSLVRNTWFLVLALVATGAATMQKPSALAATLLAGVALAGVSAVLVVRT
jgi:hypothetical protein